MYRVSTMYYHFPQTLLYFNYLPPNSIYGVDITIFQLIKPRHEEVI